MPHNNHKPNHGRRRPNPVIGFAIFIFITLFWMGAASCFLLAAHRISRGLIMAGRAQTLQVAGDSMTDEEKREVAELLRKDALRRVF
jgi:hypothetical protein